MHYIFYFKHFALDTIYCVSISGPINSYIWKRQGSGNHTSQEIPTHTSPRPRGGFQMHAPAPNITDGLLVFVQLVMAAITTEP